MRKIKLSNKKSNFVFLFIMKKYREGQDADSGEATTTTEAGGRLGDERARTGGSAGATNLICLMCLTRLLFSSDQRLVHIDSRDRRVTNFTLPPFHRRPLISRERHSLETFD